MMKGILSVDELIAKMAMLQADKKAAAVKAHDAEEDKKKALLEALSHPTGLSDEQFLEKASILVNRAVENGQTVVEVFRFPMRSAPTTDVPSAKSNQVGSAR
jgi:hypothetical protein